MGLCTFGVPRDYVDALRTACGISCFIETGTYRGETAKWAAQYFERVITIELSEPLYRDAVAALAPFPNVTVLHGDTRPHLESIAHSLPPSIVWLDAHYSTGITAGQGDECPLLGEIAALESCWQRMFILVDDARYFLAPPPPPHDAGQWPSLRDVVGALDRGPERFVAVFEDVIVSLPPSATATTLRYIREGGSLNERVLGYRQPAQRPPGLRQALRRVLARSGRT